MFNYSSLSSLEKKAYKNFKAAARFIIGGYENQAADSVKGSPEHEEAVQALYSDDILLEQTYTTGTTTLCCDGYICYDPRTVTRFMREINFIGADRLHDLADAALQKVLDQDDIVLDD